MPFDLNYLEASEFLDYIRLPRLHYVQNKNKTIIKINSTRFFSFSNLWVCVILGTFAKHHWCKVACIYIILMKRINFDSIRLRNSVYSILNTTTHVTHFFHWTAHSCSLSSKKNQFNLRHRPVDLIFSPEIMCELCSKSFVSLHCRLIIGTLDTRHSKDYLN